MTKNIFIPAKSKIKINKEKVLSLSPKLPKKIAIAYSIQYQDIAYQIKVALTDKEITSVVQVLGCSNPKFPKDTEAILIITDGKFHATSLALESGLPVYVLYNNVLEKISADDIEKLKKKKKAAYVKFLNSERIGVMVTTKPGQENLKRSLEFKNKSNKKTYLFLSNHIDTNQFENFKIESWVNSACPRLDYDYPIINISDLEKNN